MTGEVRSKAKIRSRPQAGCSVMVLTLDAVVLEPAGAMHPVRATLQLGRRQVRTNRLL